MSPANCGVSLMGGADKERMKTNRTGSSSARGLLMIVSACRGEENRRALLTAAR